MTSDCQDGYWIVLKLAWSRGYPPMIGGAEKVLSYLASALAVEGADVTVLTSRMPGMMLPAHEDLASRLGEAWQFEGRRFRRPARRGATGNLAAAVLGHLART